MCRGPALQTKHIYTTKNCTLLASNPQTKAHIPTAGAYSPLEMKHTFLLADFAGSQIKMVQLEKKMHETENN
jgi:hypothetical protein